MILDDISWSFLAGLIGLGFAVGIMTGIFGVGGAFLLVPFLISLFRVEPSLAIGTTMALSLVTGAYGFVGHLRLRNVEPISMATLGITSAAATVAGKLLQNLLKQVTGAAFDFSMKILLVLILVPMAALTWITAKQDVKPFLNHRWLKIPPLIHLHRAALTDVSLSALVLCGIGVGLLKGMTAIGAGIVIVPILIWVVGLPPLMAVGTSLGAIIISSIAGVIAYSVAGEIEWRYVAALLVGGLAGTSVGLSIVRRLNNASVKRYFPLILILVAIMMLVELVRAS